MSQTTTTYDLDRTIKQTTSSNNIGYEIKYPISFEVCGECKFLSYNIRKYILPTIYENGECIQEEDYEFKRECTFKPTFLQRHKPCRLMEDV